MVAFLITSFARFSATLISYLGLCLIKWPSFSQRTVTSVLVISQLSSASSPGTALTFSRSLKMCTGFSRRRERAFYTQNPLDSIFPMRGNYLPLTKSTVLHVRSFTVKTMSPESVSSASFIVSLYLRPLLTTWTRPPVATAWPFTVQLGGSSTSWERRQSKVQSSPSRTDSVFRR